VLLQSHAWPSAILVDELDAGSFKSPSNNINGSAARLIRSRLELVNSHDPNTRFRSKVLLAPIQERARCSALLRRDHNEGNVTAQQLLQLHRKSIDSGYVENIWLRRNIIQRLWIS
jgi:hypothetical protein